MGNGVGPGVDHVKGVLQWLVLWNPSTAMDASRPLGANATPTGELSTGTVSVVRLVVVSMTDTVPSGSCEPPAQVDDDRRPTLLAKVSSAIERGKSGMADLRGVADVM
jgi:hypothetical protein